MLYSAEMRDQIKQENPEASITDLAKILGQQWQALSEEEKLPYEARAAEGGDDTAELSLTPPADHSGFRPGDEAFLHGLVKAPGWNGLRCTIVGPFTDERYPVQVRHAGVVKNMRVRLSNLTSAETVLG